MSLDFFAILSNMKIFTRYAREKSFVLTSEKEALRMISEEFELTDAQATLEYIVTTCKKQKKVIHLGEITFKVEP